MDNYGWFFDAHGNDENATRGQFNPFVMENTPPEIYDIGVDKIVEWGWDTSFIIPVYVILHCYAKITLSIRDIGIVERVEVRIRDNGNIATFAGEPDNVYEAELNIDYWSDYLWSFEIEVMVQDTAGNEVTATKEVESAVCGLLTAIWEAIAGAMTAAWEAVVSAVNFIVEVLKELVLRMIDVVIQPILNLINDFVVSIREILNNALIETQKDDRPSSINYENAAGLIFDFIVSSHFFTILLGLSLALCAIKTAIMPIAGPFVLVEGVILRISINTIIKALVGYLVAIVAGELALLTTQTILYSVYPEESDFWKEGIGISVLGITSAIIILATQFPFIGRFGIGSNIIGDVIGLSLAITGLIISIFVRGIELSVWIAMIISAIGLCFTLVSDIFDVIFAPLAYIEETIAAVCYVHSYLTILEYYSPIW